MFIIIHIDIHNSLSIYNKKKKVNVSLLQKMPSMETGQK